MIRLTQVHKSLGGQEVLRGVDLHVKEGESVVLMGPSGAGKSVILRHIVGLLSPDSGEVRVEGRPIHHLDAEELSALRRDMGYLFQHAALINWLSVFENVALPLRETTPLKEDEIREKVEKVLGQVRLLDARSKFPAELSGGMQKRVGLARALVTEPRIILYDEPEAGLDPEMTVDILHLLNRLKEEIKPTTLTVTHSLDCATQLGDRIAVFERGRILMDAPPDEMLTSSLPRVRALLGLAE